MRLLASLRSRLIAGFGVLVLLFALLAIAAVASLRTVDRTVASELDLLSSTSGLAAGMMGAVAEQLRAGEAYLRRPAPDLALEFRRFGDSSDAYREAFRQLAATAEDRSALTRIQTNQASMEAAYTTAHALADQGELELAAAAEVQARGPADSLIDELRSLTARRQQGMADRLLELRRETTSREQLKWLLLVAALMVSTVVAYLSVRGVEDPLRQVLAATRRLGEGDLRPPALAGLPEELAELGRALTTVSSRLRGLIERVAREAGTVGAAGGDLSAMSAELAAGSEAMARQLAGASVIAGRRAGEAEDTEGIVASWTRAIARDQSAAERIVVDNERIRSLAETEAAGLTETSAVLSAMRESAQAAGGLVRSASRQAGTVSELLDLASQLASQSEVLALNAAVEAARAGPASQAVSAIAAESRRLTETSRAAAVRIAEGITALHERIGALDRAINQLATQAIQAESGGQRGAVTLGEVSRAAGVVRESAGKLVDAAAERKALAVRISGLRDRLEQEAREAGTVAEAVTAGISAQTDAAGDLKISAARLLEASERLAALVATFRT